MRIPLLVLISVASLAQQPRDTVPLRPEATGTGAIRGRVVAADTGLPLRGTMVTLIVMAPPVVPSRGVAPPTGGVPGGVIGGVVSGFPTAAVTINPGDVGRPRQVTVDAEGVFEFTALPAGSYRVTANPGQWYAQYIGISYGAKGPMSDFGQRIELAAGQVFDKATIALPRGAVIAGRVVDDLGQPIARVQVSGLWFPVGSSRGVRNSGGIQTDDLGQFRLYGLRPGDYVVVAEARNNTFVPPNAPVDPEEAPNGLMTTYYPGVADEASAQRVRAAIGRETTGVEIRMIQGRLYRMSGNVVDSQGRPSARVNGSLMQMGPGSGVSFGSGFSTDEQGRFQMRNIAPGNYRLVIRPRMESFGPNGPPKLSGEAANMPVTVAGDVEGLTVVTSPGATITGQIVFESAPPSPLPQLRVFATPGEMDGMGFGGLNPQPAVVRPDLTFTMTGMLGEYTLRASAPNLFLKSVTVGAEDVTDTPREFKARDRVTIVLTSRASTLEGTVTDASGQPSSTAAVMLFPEDQNAWRWNSSRIHRTSVDAAGHYRIRGVMPGRYYVIAGPRERVAVPGPVAPSFFEGLTKEATSIVMGEDEQRTADLRVADAGSDNLELQR